MKLLKKYTLSAADHTLFEAIGIVSPERDYKLCFRLNKALGLNLSKDTYIYLFSQQVRREILCYFSYIEDMKRKIYLIRNKQEEFYVVPKFKKMDFIMLIIDPVQENLAEELRKSISEIPNIQTTFVLPNELTKNISFE